MDDADRKRIADIAMNLKKERWENGDKKAVLDAIFQCLYQTPAGPVPEWCATAFCDAYLKIINHDAKNWDDIFGRPHPRGTHVEHLRDLCQNRTAVFDRVEELRAQGVAVDGDLFLRVGKALGIGSKTTTEEYYYFMKDIKKIDTGEISLDQFFEKHKREIRMKKW